MSTASDGVVTLREITQADLPLLREWDRRVALDQPFNYFSDFTREVEASGAGDAEISRLLVCLAEGTPIGDVSWHHVAYGPNARSAAYNIGIGLQPAHRGRGYGSRAQALLATYLFSATEVYRVEASTDVENLAEQRALDKAGFSQDGVLRGAQFRDGTFRDLVLFSRLRSD